MQPFEEGELALQTMIGRSAKKISLRRTRIRELQGSTCVHERVQMDAHTASTSLLHGPLVFVVLGSTELEDNLIKNLRDVRCEM